MFSEPCSEHTLRMAAIIVLFMLVITNLSPAANAATYSWTKLNTAQSLPARAGFATAYDPISKKVVVFGGFNATGQLTRLGPSTEPRGLRSRLRLLRRLAPLLRWRMTAGFTESCCSADSSGLRS